MSGTPPSGERQCIERARLYITWIREPAGLVLAQAEAMIEARYPGSQTHRSAAPLVAIYPVSTIVTASAIASDGSAWMDAECTVGPPSDAMPRQHTHPGSRTAYAMPPFAEYLAKGAMLEGMTV